MSIYTDLDPDDISATPEQKLNDLKKDVAAEVQKQKEKVPETKEKKHDRL